MRRRRGGEARFAYEDLSGKNGSRMGLNRLATRGVYGSRGELVAIKLGADETDTERKIRRSRAQISA
jgi:hypothetical protein